MKLSTTILLVAFTSALSAVITKEIIQQQKGPSAPLRHSESTNANSATPINSAIEQARLLVTKASNGKVKIMDHFDAGGGLIGFVLQEQGKTEPAGIVYTNANGTLLISASAIINMQGENLLQRDFARYIQPEQATQAYQTIQKTAFLQDGKDTAPHKMYVMLDPNCPHCHTAYLALQEKIQAGEVMVRWIVVGNITSTSQSKALAILGADDPLKALNFNETNFDVAGHSGGITGTDNPSLLASSKLKSNMDFVMGNKLAYTPSFFFKTKEGIIKLIPGALNGDKLEDAIQSASDQF